MIILTTNFVICQTPFEGARNKAKVEREKAILINSHAKSIADFGKGTGNRARF